jgi:hypothetical protein
MLSDTRDLLTQQGNGMRRPPCRGLKYFSNEDSRQIPAGLLAFERSERLLSRPLDGLTALSFVGIDARSRDKAIESI